MTKPPTKYERTAEEQRAIEAAHARDKALPRWTVEKGDDGVRVTPDHPDQALATVRLMEAIGTDSQGFYVGIANQIAQATGADEGEINFMWETVKGLKPQDEAEAMLATQMAAIHLATMTYARRLQKAEFLPQSDHAGRTLNRLARTFTTQMETLKRYRRGGEQKVTVEHVHVHDGGQAIVGSVTKGGDGA